MNILPETSQSARTRNGADAVGPSGAHVVDVVSGTFSRAQTSRLRAHLFALLLAVELDAAPVRRPTRLERITAAVMTTLADVAPLLTV